MSFARGGVVGQPSLAVVDGGCVLLRPHLPGIVAAADAGTIEVSSDVLEVVRKVLKRGISFMGALSDYLESAWLGTLKGTAFSVTSGNIHIALYTATPGETGGGTEVSGGSYARQAVAAANWSAVSAGEPSIIDNTAVIQFPTATASWGTITSVGVRDALSAGNLLYFGALVASKVVDNGDTFKFNIGALDLGVG